jgi:hypothetical protein
MLVHIHDLVAQDSGIGRKRNRLSKKCGVCDFGRLKPGENAQQCRLTGSIGPGENVGAGRIYREFPDIQQRMFAEALFQAVYRQ